MFDAARACDAEFVVRSGPAEGLRGAVERVARAAGATPRTFVAVARDERANYAIEAIHTPRGERLILDALTVRVKLRLDSVERGLRVACVALDAFGGNGYVSLGASRGSARTGFEATVCFPDVFPWLAQNTLIAPRLVALDDLEHFAGALRELGVAHRVNGQKLELQRFQLRLRPRRERILRAFALAVKAGLRASVYAASLPVTRSLRIEQSGLELDVAITRGLSRAPCSHADIREMDAFLFESFGFGAAALDFRVRAAGVVLPKPPSRGPVLQVIRGGRSARP